MPVSALTLRNYDRKTEELLNLISCISVLIRSSFLDFFLKIVSFVVLVMLDRLPNELQDSDGAIRL